MLKTIQGYIDVTVRIPFTAVDDVDEENPTSAQDWVDMANSGLDPDALEGSTMEAADATVHEVVSWEIEEAWYVTPEHDHAQRCCRDHGTHAMPHRGCILR
ncbi:MULTISPECIES: hypothetical protein [unclassified Microbacterium]|uniref:hypothetical protein n=1 Tax=unclassified Microbacterium TaxID=2609290 RepID=UPI003016A7FF